LLDAELKAAQQQWQQLAETMKQQREEEKRLATIQQQQEQARQRLVAGGDIITLDLLRHTRQQRDHDWQTLRQQLAAQENIAPAALQAFEVLTKQADDQADMLRDDVKRAAQYEQISAQLLDVAQQQANLAAAQTLSHKQQTTLEHDWSERLNAAHLLPNLLPDAVAEWQQKRSAALQLLHRHHELEDEHQQLAASMQEAATALQQALQEAAISHASDASLSSLIATAQQWEREITASEARQEEQQKATAQRKREHRRNVQALKQAQDAMQQYQSVVQAYMPRLFLAGDSSIAAVRARLDELNALDQAHSQQRQSEQQLQHHAATIAAFDEQAALLASVVEEAAIVDAVDFAERMQQRLEASETQQQQKERILKDVQRAEQQGATAEQALQQQQARLQALCLAAGVDALEALPEQEQRAQEKKHYQTKVNDLTKQLRQASPDDIATLRGQLDGYDIAALETDLKDNEATIQRLCAEQQQAHEVLNKANHALQALDTSNEAAAAREAMESAIATCATSIAPWARLKLAHTLLQRAVNQFREQSQAPMLLGASHYFALMTDGRYSGLLVDDSEKAGLVLLAKRHDGSTIPISAMSEGTLDQLYLSLRLASLDMRSQKNAVMPLVLDDVLMTSDDHRAAHTLRALASFAEHGQVLLFTHHHHITTLAKQTLTKEGVCIHELVMH
jgi:uncharacterized protein YhaN